MASNTNGTKPMAAAARLRAQLADPNNIVVCPGIYDGFTARIALATGFDCLYMTGAGTSMSVLGMADLGITTINEMATQASMIAGLDRNVPLIADGDTGGAGPLQMRKMIQQYTAGGVAGLHIEDQVVTKRCGHLANKQVVDEDMFVSRIRAAALARDEMPNGDIVIIARTDALQGLGYDAAISRLKAAVAAGADVAFLEGPTSKEDMRRVCADMAPTPVLLNMVSAGATPATSVDEAREMGFRIIIFPGAALGAVYKGVGDAMAELRQSGTIATDTAPGSGPRALFEICGLKDLMAFDMKAGGLGFKNGV
jgi:2-methylisocitrate lyase-like PEP mutase family enzyme